MRYIACKAEVPLDHTSHKNAYDGKSFLLELSEEQLSAKDLTCTIDPTYASSLITAK